jgi:cation diffusion facilitator CzcD-associated flavoprotein CzcO
MKCIQLGHRVIRSGWSASESQWHVIVEVVESGTIIHDRCDVLLSATGVLKYSFTEEKCKNPG